MFARAVRVVLVSAFGAGHLGFARCSAALTGWPSFEWEVVER